MRSAYRHRALAVALLVATALMPARALAIVVDGQLEPSYTLMSTQTTQTNGLDDTQGLPGFGAGSELDAAWAAMDGSFLYLFFAGNLKDTICGRNACTDFAMLNVFIDSQSGGQNPLVSSEPSGSGFSYVGIQFDTGFSPDYWVQYANTGALSNSFQRDAWYESLPAGGGAPGVHLGSGTNAGAPATLSGGTNPYGFLATIDNRNTAGVGAGCAAASGAGVTTGVELAIPLAAIGNPTNCIKVAAFLVDYNESPGLLNQALPPVPPGTCTKTFPPSIDFSAIPGDQFFSVCFAATPTRGSTWGRLKSIYR